jgi:hypothetical protein
MQELKISDLINQMIDEGLTRKELKEKYSMNPRDYATFKVLVKGVRVGTKPTVSFQDDREEPEVESLPGIHHHKK